MTGTIAFVSFGFRFNTSIASMVGNTNSLTFFLNLVADFLHHRQSAVGTCANHELTAFPGYVFPSGQRRVAKLFAKVLGWFFLALADLTTIDHNIVLARSAVNLNGAEGRLFKAHTHSPVMNSVSPLAKVGISLFSAKEPHRFVILDLPRPIHDGDNLP